MRIFRPHVDVALGGAHREAGDHHALDQHERIAFEDHAVCEGAGIALVTIADDIFAVCLRFENSFPFDPGREAGAATAAQSGFGDFRNDLLRRHGERLLEAADASMGAVVLERERIDDAAAGECQSRLPLEERNLFRIAERESVVAFAFGQSGIEEALDVARLDRAISHPALERFHFDHGLQPVEAARPVADNLDIKSALFGFAGDCKRDLVRSERKRT